MRVCPNCGYQNDDTSEICINCDWVLPPPAPPEQPPAEAPGAQVPIQLSAVPAQHGARKGRQYFLGLGLGLIPLLVFLLATGLTIQPGSYSSGNLEGALVLLLISLVLYFALLIATIVYLSRRDQRFVGYGLLTAVLTSPIIGAIACIAGLNSR